MTRVRLRAVRAADLPLLASGSPEDDPFQFFGFTATNAVERQFAANGFISDDAGQLVVEDHDATVVGGVGWFAVRHGPSSTARAFNIGIRFFRHTADEGWGPRRRVRSPSTCSRTRLSSAWRPARTSRTWPSSEPWRKRASRARG